MDNHGEELQPYNHISETYHNALTEFREPTQGVAQGLHYPTVTLVDKFTNSHPQEAVQHKWLY
jgi:hypothetical protein